MSNQIEILKQSLTKDIWHEEDHIIEPYLSEERGKYKGQSKLLLKPNSTNEVSRF